MKKALSLTLALLFLVSLCACGSTGTSSAAAEPSGQEVQSAPEEAAEAPEEAPAEPPEAAAPEESSAEEEPAEEEPAPLEDAEGMMNPTEMGIEYIYPVEDGGTITIFNALHTNLTDVTEYDQFDWMPYVEAETGYDLEWTTVEQGVFRDKINIMLASGDYTDLVMNFSDASYTLSSALDDEIIVDLTDKLEELSPNYYALLHAPGNEDFLRDCSDDNGSYLCYWMLQNTAVTTEGYWVRTDMLEAAGVQDIPATYDQWEEAMLAVKNSGKYDLKTGLLVNSESFSQYFSYGYDIPGTRISNGLYHVDGEIRGCYTEDAFREYLTMMHNWYDQGLLYSDFPSMDSNPMSSEITSMITQDQAIVYSAWNNSADGYKSQANNPDFAVKGISEPMMTEGQVGHFANASRVNNMHNLVITSSADVEACMTFCDWWYTGKGIDLYNYGQEGVDWNWNADHTEREYSELITNAPDGNTVQTAWSRYNVYGNFIGYSNEWRSNWTYAGEELEAMETWTGAMDNIYSLPLSFMSLTTDETTAISTPVSDVDTYISEHLAKMVTGEEDITDDSLWNGYVETVESMGYQTIIDTYQAAYDRYLSRS